MTLPPSASDFPSPSAPSAFARLDSRVQHWIWDQNWTELRDIQEEAIDAILDTDVDIIISAATASGKTEAAFLPLCSQIADKATGSVRILYISPLKALINDQSQRLQGLCSRLSVPVHRWHGDVYSHKKKSLLADPSGILLMTPESLEALFILRGPQIAALFAHLSCTIVDELHAFIGTERGRQLQSLLHRTEVVLNRRVRRIGLSATLSEMYLTADFLRPGESGWVRIIESQATGQELKIKLQGYYVRSNPPADDEITRQLFTTLYNSDNLIFPNTRQQVEWYADTLRELCAEQGVPNVFLPHHGNLSKVLREEAEARLKDKTRPVSLICTSTLELGIDVGSVHSIAQIGVPPSVASLRQRLGRSGRRGNPAILRAHIAESPNPRHPQDAIRAELVQAIAMIQLLLRRWVEAPAPQALHLSTLVQQTLSLIAQYGGFSASSLWHILCKTGPFSLLDSNTYALFLRALAQHNLIIQSGDGTLLLGQAGERLVNNYKFYAAFEVPEEYRLLTSGKSIGTLPVDFPVVEGMRLIFAGRRWTIKSIDHKRRALYLISGAEGFPPRFSGQGFRIQEPVRREMLAIYRSSSSPPYLDSVANALLAEGRQHFAFYRLAEQPVVQMEEELHLFFWTSDRIRHTVGIQLCGEGVKIEDHGLCLTALGTSLPRLQECIRHLVELGPADAFSLARQIPSKEVEKHDRYLTDELLAADYAAKRLDTQGAWVTLHSFLACMK